MDGEFFTIMVVGVLFIAGAGGFLLWQRRKENQDEEPAPPKSTAGSSKASKLEEPKEKKSLLSAFRGGNEKKPDAKSKSKSKGPTQQEKKELEEIIAAGHIDEAARVAMRLQLWDKAAQLYLKADQPGNAAHCAKRAGKFEMAAEFYEKAGEVESAVRMWEKAGNTQRARELAGVKPEASEEQDAVIQISKELQAEIDAAIEKKDYMRASELYEQGGDKEHAAEQFAAFAQTARRPEVYAEKIRALSPRVAYNMLRIAIKGRPPGEKSAELYRRVASLQNHFGNVDAAKKTLQKLVRALPEDEEAARMLEEIEGAGPAEGGEDGAVPADVGSSPGDEAGGQNGDDVADPALEAARSGPGIAELVGMIGGQSCDLGNIEVYYRLGMACLAAGKRDDARRAFRAVDEVSPGYRDIDKRLGDLKK